MKPYNSSDWDIWWHILLFHQCYRFMLHSNWIVEQHQPIMEFRETTMELHKSILEFHNYCQFRELNDSCNLHRSVIQLHQLNLECHKYVLKIHNYCRIIDLHKSLEELHNWIMDLYTSVIELKHGLMESTVCKWGFMVLFTKTHVPFVEIHNNNDMMPISLIASICRLGNNSVAKASWHHVLVF